MFLEDVLKEFLFDCRLRKLSERTLKGYRKNNLAFLGISRANLILPCLRKFIMQLFKIILIYLLWFWAV